MKKFLIINHFLKQKNKKNYQNEQKKNKQKQTRESERMNRPHLFV